MYIYDVQARENLTKLIHTHRVCRKRNGRNTRDFFKYCARFDVNRNGGKKCFQAFNSNLFFVLRFNNTFFSRLFFNGNILILSVCSIFGVTFDKRFIRRKRSVCTAIQRHTISASKPHPDVRPDLKICFFQFYLFNRSFIFSLSLSLSSCYLIVCNINRFIE